MSFWGSIDASDWLSAFSIVLNIGAVLQDKWLHEEAKRTSHRQHIEQCNTERINNLQQLETGMRSQIQSLGTDMTLAGKEAERDMWEQRNTQFQTLMLAATVMFGGGLGVITQGTMPADVPLPYLVLYSSSVGLGFGLLFISIMASMAILKRMCKYMYCRARNHRVNLHNILDKAMSMVETFDRHQHKRHDIEPLPFKPGMAESITHEYGSFIQDMINQIREAKNRENIIVPSPSSSAPRVMTMSEAETSSMSFADFWDMYCRAPASVATNLFYAGTLSLLVSVTTMTTSQLAFQYNSYASALPFCGICALSMAFAFFYYAKHSDMKGLPRPPGWLMQRFSSIESPSRRLRMRTRRSLSLRRRCRGGDDVAAAATEEEEEEDGRTWEEKEEEEEEAAAAARELELARRRAEEDRWAVMAEEGEAGTGGALKSPVRWRPGFWKAGRVSSQ